MSTVAASGTFYAIVYSYAGDGALNAANNALTKLTVTNPPPVTASISLAANKAVKSGSSAARILPTSVQTATNLLGPWQSVGTSTADGAGLWQFTDPSATNGQQFYRTVTQ